MGEYDQTQKMLDTIEALLKDIEQALAERGELNEEYKGAIERLRQLCGEEKARQRVEEAVRLDQDLGTRNS